MGAMTTILVVDDEPIVRDVVVRYLQRDGFDTLEAADGESARELIETASPALVVLDVMLPGIDGLALCRWIAEYYPVEDLTELVPALATIVMGLQSSAMAIIAWRFIASIGVGLELVAIDCYLAELTPKTVRGRAFAVSASIQFLSAPLVAFLAWRLIPGDLMGVAGWRWLTFVPGIGGSGLSL